MKIFETPSRIVSEEIGKNLKLEKGITMKIIDLLNKIANGEEVPEKIFYANQHWINRYPNDYEGIGYGGCLLNNVCLNNLNDEIEIIEEDKKIEKIKVEYSPDIEEKIFYEDGDKHNNCILGDTGTELLINKINELIDKVNNMENNK